MTPRATSSTRARVPTPSTAVLVGVIWSELALAIVLLGLVLWWVSRRGPMR